MGVPGGLQRGSETLRSHVSDMSAISHLGLERLRDRRTTLALYTSCTPCSAPYASSPAALEIITTSNVFQVPLHLWSRISVQCLDTSRRKTHRDDRGSNICEITVSRASQNRSKVVGSQNSDNIHIRATYKLNPNRSHPAGIASC